MTAPTNTVRQATYRRDNHQCVNCGTHQNLEWNHRQSSGMGGSKYKPNPADGVTACSLCNAGFEAHLQGEAIYRGWKVRRFTPVPVHLVPVWYRFEHAWFLLNTDGSRDELDAATAAEYRGMAGIYDEEVT